MSKDPKSTAPKPPPSLESRFATIMRLLASCTEEERVKIVGALSSMYLGRQGVS
jgi:hypothetical protein